MRYEVHLYSICADLGGDVVWMWREARGRRRRLLDWGCQPLNMSRTAGWLAGWPALETVRDR